MRIITPSTSLPRIAKVSIFLAGPTPRSPEVQSWRPAAFDILRDLNFTGDVIAPEPFTGEFESQVSWEHHGLENCGVICFWVPRDLSTLPGFTTNVEFGLCIKSKPILYGRPNSAAKTKYLDWVYSKYCEQAPITSLAELLRSAVQQLESKPPTNV